jgi:ATP adenylyltransferase
LLSSLGAPVWRGEQIGSVVERLWTPWRMQYVGGAQRPGCVFCDALAAGDDVGQLILLRAERAFIILNLYPYNSGHAMLVPNAHVAQLDDLDAATRAELLELASDFTVAARRVLRCAGFNLGLNLGAVAGAGVADHLHLHVVPRWLGDANFMPLLAGTTVMPELLPVTYARLRAELERQVVERRPGGVALAGALPVIPSQRQVALWRTADGEVVLPNTPIGAEEPASDAALRALRATLGASAVVAGWAGSVALSVAETQPERTNILLALIALIDAPAAWPPDAVLVDIDALPGTLTRPAEQSLAHAAASTLRAVAEQG